MNIHDIMKNLVNKYKTNGGSMKELGEKIGLSQPTISRYLNGSLPLNRKFIKKFSDALELPESTLLSLVQSQIEINVKYTLSGLKVDEVVKVVVLDLSIDDAFGIKVDQECAELRTGTIIIASESICPAERDSVVLISGTKAHYGILV